MAESSKILTVSYGTFSCTLEGFDDSFSTMKAIAEYFRDLAAGDRYFGAEPPTPDAEMLTRIAEREISRRVEARSSDAGGIVLRASDAPQSADAAPVPQTRSTPQAAAPLAVADQPREEPAAPQAAPVPQSVADKLKRIRSVVGASPVATDEDEDMTPAPPLADSDVPVDQPATPQAPVVADTDADLLTTSDAPHPSDSDATDDADDATDSSTQDHIDATPVAAQEDSAAAQNPADDAQDDDAQGDDAQTTDDSPTDEASADNSVTDDAPVDEAPVDEAPVDDATVDDATVDDATVDQDVFGATDPDLGDTAPRSDAADTVDATPPSTEGSDTDADTRSETLEIAEPDDTDDRIQAVLRNLERAGLTAGDQRPSDRTDATPQAADTAAEDADRPHSKTDSKTDTDLDVAATVAARMAAKAPADAAAPDQPRRPRILRVARKPQPTDDAETETRVSEARGRLAALLGKPDEAADTTDADTGADTGAVATADPQSVDAPSDVTPTVADQGPTDTVNDRPAETPSSLSPVDEDELQSALAQAESDALAELRDRPGQSLSLDALDAAKADDAETETETAPASDDPATQKADAVAPDSAGPVTQPDPQDAPDPTADQQAARQTRPSTPEDEMSRLSAKAEEELASPESSRRRSAIAHLKAAVAATEAARQLGEPAKKSDDGEGAFRNDLAQVVRPRRPVASSDTPRERPAPLKLVASQRVDDKSPAPSEPVQPRRVATTATPDPVVTGSFADYAASVGATSLQDLLEAAAAYTATVEGAEDFSRPQIMKMVETTAADPFSREDGLRSFGTLLRQGRIEKGGNGRFQISERTRFRPEAQAANA